MSWRRQTWPITPVMLKTEMGKSTQASSCTKKVLVFHSLLRFNDRFLENKVCDTFTQIYTLFFFTHLTSGFPTSFKTIASHAELIPFFALFLSYIFTADNGFSLSEFSIFWPVKKLFTHACLCNGVQSFLCFVFLSCMKTETKKPKTGQS